LREDFGRHETGRTSADDGGCMGHAPERASGLAYGAGLSRSIGTIAGIRGLSASSESTASGSRIDSGI
jgi:hypothetical protein